VKGFFFNYRIQKNRLGLIASALIFFLLTAVLNGVYAQSGDEAAASFWLWTFLGRLHPMIVHFPIGLLLFAAVLEGISYRNFQSPYRPGINGLILAGVISSGVSAAFGWLLAQDGDYGEDLLFWHQWIGIATFGLACVTGLFLKQAIRSLQLQKIKIYRLSLLCTIIGVSVAGHYGASLTHGKDYLTETLPWSSSEEALADNPAVSALLTSQTETLTPEQEVQLNVQVRAILAHNCYQCHGEEKVKGELRLDEKKYVFQGGESGPVIVPGDPEKSDLFRRINLPADHKDVMPTKGKLLSKSDIAIIELWIRKGAPWPDDAEKQTLFREASLAPRNPPLPSVVDGRTNPIDRLLNVYFQQNDIEWPSLVDDKTFIRRVYLDIIGLLPTPAEFQAFANDTRPDKRELLVRELLSREDAYAQHWLTFWNDALRNDYTGPGYITGGRFNITDWLYQSIKNNKPYDQFVQELVSPTDASKGFVEGIRWRGAVNASQVTEMQAAQNVAQVFLGVNLKCASCHNSFTSNWKLTDAYAFANIFADSSLEINRCDKPTGKFTRPGMLWRELGQIDSLASRKEKMAQLAQNIVKPENGRLYRTLVNRIWAQLMGRGLVEPVDLMDNEPWNQDLLDWLAYDFQQNGKNIKELIYLIATSKAYQLPSVGFKAPTEWMDKSYVFKGVIRKRLTAEQFADAAGLVAGPLFFDSMRMYQPVVTTATPAFTRASLVANNRFLTALGRPNRENVSTSRESQPNLLQALELTNGDRFNAGMQKAAAQWKAQYKTGDAILQELYSRALNRQPNKKEKAAALKWLGTNPNEEVIQDFFWAMLLLPEFQLIY
jgi:uncharacterized membrane protein